MSKRTMLVELTDNEYINMCKIIPTLKTRSHIKIADVRKIQSLPRYSVLDNHIINQYRIDDTYTLNYHERRQLTKLHKGLLKQKLNGYSIIKYFCFGDVELSNRDLSNIQLREGNLSGGNFKNSNLTNCDLSRTNLRGADFTGANLENAKFDIERLGKYQGKDTIFTGANLKGTILENNN